MRLSIEHDNIKSSDTYFTFTNFSRLKEHLLELFPNNSNAIYSVKLNLFQSNSAEQHRHRPQRQNIFMIPFLNTTDVSSKFTSSSTNTICFQVSSSFFAILTDNSDYKNTIRLLEEDTNLIHEMIEIDSIHVGSKNDTTEPENGILLPNCPICISRIDKSITGMNSISCTDIYHSCCLEKCKQLVKSSCKACELLLSTEGGVRSCSDCGSSDDANLWICLNCGNIGCGRYKGGHAHNHFLTSNHSFALNLDSYHIWDYCNDKYVHRSVKNAEGTTVAVDDITLNGRRNLQGNNGIDESEETYINDILAAQLESQRAYYDERLVELKKRHESELTALNSLHSIEIKKIETDLAHFNTEKKVSADLRVKLQESVKAFKLKAESFANDLEVEKKITKGLTETIDKLESERIREAEIKMDLEDQIKDLMKHMEVLDLMNKAGNDPSIVQGQIYVRPSNNSNTKHGKHHHCK